MAGPADDNRMKGTPPRAPAIGSSGANASTEPADKPNTRPSVRPGGAKGLIGTTISDRYKILKLLGEGGMGAVYQAEHTLMRKRMAVKVLHPEMTRLPEVVARFEREAMAAAHIDHPNVVTATDFGKLEDGSFFLALEFVEGKSLREVIAVGRLELGRALHIGRQIAAALQRAHTLKIVHRDLKPENVMLVERDGDTDFVKVLDFGIAKVQIGELTENRPGEPGQAILTQAGMVYGTPEYMAPEQALGQPVDARADLYALGIILYEMLTGFRPFDAESKVALLGMQVTAPVPPMIAKAPDVTIPPEVEALTTKLLAKEAAERTSDAREVIEGISALLNQLAAAGLVDARYAPPPASGLVTNPGLISSISQVPPAPSPGVGNASDDKKTTQAAMPGSGLLAGKQWMIAAGAGTVAILVLLVTIIVVMRGGPKTEGVADADVTTTIEAGPPAQSLDQKVADAIAMIDRGDHGSGIKALESLGTEIDDREDAQKALFTAYAATKADALALKAAHKWLKANPNLDLSSEATKELRGEVRDAAISDTKSLQDEGFALLEKEMGTVGWEIVFDIAYGQSGMNKKAAADRAKGELARGPRAKMSPALAVTLDLIAASEKGCAAVKAQLPVAAEKGDERTITVLRPLAQPRIIGHFKKADVLGCIHGADKPVDKTIAAIEERTKKK